MIALFDKEEWKIQIDPDGPQEYAGIFDNRVGVTQAGLETRPPVYIQVPSGLVDYSSRVLKLDETAWFEISKESSGYVFVLVTEKYAVPLWRYPTKPAWLMVRR